MGVEMSSFAPKHISRTPMCYIAIPDKIASYYRLCKDAALSRSLLNRLYTVRKSLVMPGWDGPRK